MPISPKNDWSLAQWLDWQESLHPKSIALGLERVHGVAQRLGVLEKPPLTLTIAGTNGKGSSATLAALSYQSAGYTTGLYTSPHLLLYNERVQIDGREASDEALCTAFHEIEQARQGTPLTYFEYGTLAALWLFRDAGVDVQVLEVGLGGRLDAVNIVDADCALVTSIGLDHLDWLGPDRESIGREKAGIFRGGRPAICSDPQPPASIAAAARDSGAQLQQLHRHYDYAAVPGGWTWSGSPALLPRPALPGDIQLQNAAGVFAAIRALDERLPVPLSAFIKALKEIKLPGRFQQQGRMILDVAHNAEAAEVLARNLRALKLAQPPRVVLGMLADKPVEQVGRVLAAVAGTVYLGGLPGPRGLSAEALALRLRESGLAYKICADIPAALALARSEAAADELIVVTGSFLTVAAAISSNG